jgi:hypothetical protein
MTITKDQIHRLSARDLKTLVANGERHAQNEVSRYHDDAVGLLPTMYAALRTRRMLDRSVRRLSALGGPRM